MQPCKLLEIMACIVKRRNYFLHCGNPEDMQSTAFNRRLHIPGVSRCCKLAHPSIKYHWQVLAISLQMQSPHLSSLHRNDVKKLAHLLFYTFHFLWPFLHSLQKKKNVIWAVELLVFLSARFSALLCLYTLHSSLLDLQKAENACLVWMFLSII